MEIRKAVLERYSQGARTRQETLCCPVDCDETLLTILPRELIERDYGCGDPSSYVRAGDVVLDLGSGSGKNCYMAAQIAGPRGQVIGVDMNRDMLALARKHQAQIASRLGFDGVSFKRGHIEDLALDLERIDAWLQENPVNDADSLEKFERWRSSLRENEPMVQDDSVDLVMSNCVLNLVDDRRKTQLLDEVYRVLKPCGRVAIADIVSDETVPERMKEDPHLWSGCIAGALQEQAFVEAFKNAGFVAVHVDKWAEQAWQIIDGIEFRSITVTAEKPSGSECLDCGQAVIYRGPYASVSDDEHHVFPRGERMAVCERTYRFLTEGPCADDFIGISPTAEREPVPWCASAGTKRPPAETKGATHATASGSESACC